MKSLIELRSLLIKGKIELTAHAFKRLVERNISLQEIREAGETIEIIEDYPDDKYFPSCLLLGFSIAGRPLHLHVSKMDGDCVRLITIYEPNPSEWVNNYRKRKE